MQRNVESFTSRGVFFNFEINLPLVIFFECWDILFRDDCSASIRIEKKNWRFFQVAVALVGFHCTIIESILLNIFKIYRQKSFCFSRVHLKNEPLYEDHVTFIVMSSTFGRSAKLNAQLWKGSSGVFVWFLYGFCTISNSWLTTEKSPFSAADIAFSRIWFRRIYLGLTRSISADRFGFKDSFSNRME